MQLDILIQYHQPLFFYLNKKLNINIGEARHFVSARIISEHIWSYLTSNACQRNDEQFLLELQIKLEEEMAKTISKRSIYYWFHLYRRIGVEKSFGESAQTLSLYRDIMEIAFKKYGKDALGNDFISITEDSIKENLQKIANGQYIESLKYLKIEESMKYIGSCMALHNFSEQDYFEIFILECLAYNYWYTTSCLRRLYKGGKLLIPVNRPTLCPFQVDVDQKLNKLIKSFDTRNLNYSELKTSGGVMLNNANNNPKFIMVLPHYNTDRYDISQCDLDTLFQINVFDISGKKFIPNFIWSSIDFGWYYSRHASMKEAFKEKYHYSMESFVSTIYLILYLNYIDSYQNPGSIMAIQRAYRYYESISTLRKRIQSLASTAPDNIPFTLNIDELDSILQDMILPTNRSIMSLSTRGPQYPLFYADSKLIVDYRAIYNVLEYKMHNLESGSETKGHDFEEYVNNRLKAKGHNLWECQKKLKHKDGSSKEIDISFTYEGYLFVGELKCHTKSASYDIGDSKTLECRQTKMEKALRQANDKACWLQKHTKGTNFDIPDDVHTIVPFVVTPFVEYIWGTDDNLWLTESVPRICTPAECELLCSKENIQEISTKPFLVNIKP